ncbi:MAG: protein kinase domain-containing protein, partial [Candidatus Korobacteraceae bacterium]
VEAPGFSPAKEGEGRMGLQPQSGLKPESEEEPDRGAEAPRFHPAAAPADAGLTGIGVAIGTAGYMSPEQVLGEKLDARTDIFSLGLVLYEMATGRRAFSGNTAAVVHGAILNQPPIAIHDLNSLIPQNLEDSINKALEKDRERRYQTAAEMTADFEAIQRLVLPPEPSAFEPAPVRRGKPWQLAAAVALACALSAAVWWWLKPPKITDVVLADFSNATSDSAFNDSLNTALRTELEQTPYLNLLAADKVRGILKSLNYPETQRLTAEVAGAVCLRSNSKAVVGGSIRDVGNRYRIELKATDCKTGKTLAATSLETANRDEIVKTLGMAGNEFRRKLGEPRESLQRFNQPLDQATSASPEALQAFTEGWEQKRQRGDAPAVPYFKRAVDLDPNFAQAYAFLGVGYRNLAEAKPSMENLRKAYELGDRATQRQRFYINGTYFRLATGDRERAIQSFTDWAKTYPKDPVAHVSLSAVLMEVGQPEKAALEAQESIRLQPTAAAYTDEIGSLLKVGRLEDARAVLQEAQDLKIGSHLLPLYQYMVSFLAGDTAASEEQVRSVTGISRGGLLCLHSYAQAFYGRFVRERDFLGQLEDLARHDNAPDSAADCISSNALQEVEAGNFTEARQQAASALALSQGRDIQASAALALARAGDVEGAEKLAQQLNQDHPQDTIMQYYSLPTIRAAIALQRKNPVEAIEILKVALPYELGGVSFSNLYPAYVRGEAYLQAGQGQQAAMEFQKLLDHPGVVGLSVLGPLSHLQLARAQVMMGDRAAARKSYQDFFAIWKDADPDVPVYKQAKAEYARLH